MSSPSAAASSDVAVTPTFESLGVPAELARSLAARGIAAPFPIQSATIPAALAGRDVCGRAPTGSGKTLAFGIPLMQNVHRARPHHPRALVLAPTRELAAQICDELRQLADPDQTIEAFYGGVGFGNQLRALRKGVDVAVACPGRLADLINQGHVRLGEVDLVVLDEADRMADMGFLPEVKRLLDACASKRQTLLFSATLDGDVDVIIRRYMHDPVRHEEAGADADGDTAEHLYWARRARGPHRPGRPHRVAHRPDGRVLSHQARRRPRGQAARHPWRRCGGHPRRPQPEPARAGARGLPLRARPGDHRDRRRGPRHPRRRRELRHPLRSVRGPEGLRAPLRSYRQRPAPPAR